MMDSSKAFSLLLNSTQMHLFVTTDGIMDVTTDAKKILASGPFSQALIDEQMNTLVDNDGRDEPVPTRIKSTRDASHRSVDILFGYSLPAGISVLPIDEPGRTPMSTGGRGEVVVTGHTARHTGHQGKAEQRA